MSTTQNSTETFFRSRFFKGLSQEELAPVAEICQRKHIKAGATLVHQNDPAQYVYTVLSGTLMLERTSNAGRRQVIGFSFSGDFVGITNSTEYDYSVVCLQEALIQAFPRKRFLELVDSNPKLKENARNTGRNIHAQALDQLFALGQKKSHERLCFFINQISQRQPGTDRDDIKLIMNRQDIADYLGLTIETVSRGFAKLKKDGVISIESTHRVKILDQEALEEMASSSAR